MATETKTAEEIWATIPGFSRYEASSTGRIRNKTNGRNRKTHKRPSGYIVVTLVSDSGKLKNCFVHRLVVSAFRGELLPSEVPIDHINRLRDDNNLTNLRVATVTENNRNRASGLSRQVRKVDQFEIVSGKLVRTHASATDAAKSVGVTYRSIWCALAGSRQTSGGFTWRYAPCAEIDGVEQRSLVVENVNIEVFANGCVQFPNGRVTRGTLVNGYLRVQIGGRTHGIHRLVASAFLGQPPSELHVADHIDSDRTNNGVSNLRWVTKSANTMASFENGAKKAAKRKISEISADGTVVNSWASIKEAAEATGVHAASIGRVSRGELKTTGKRKFQYDDLDVRTMPVSGASTLSILFWR